MNIIKIIFILVFHFFFLKSDLIPIFYKCCARGFDWYKINKKFCPNFNLPLLNLPPAQRRDCKGVVDFCCLNYKQEEQCHEGMSLAKIKNNCDSFAYKADFDFAKICCHCCNIGLLMGKSGRTCKIPMSISNKNCEKSFLSCCHGEKDKNKNFPSTFNPFLRVSLSTSIPSPVSLAPHTDMCLLFKNDLCEHKCVSTKPNEYKCYCNHGYHLMKDNKSCRLNTSVSKTITCGAFSKCTQICEMEKKNGGGGRGRGGDEEEDEVEKCSCKEGYKLAGDGFTCQDIDECVENKENLCGEGGMCVNTMGSFRCISSYSLVTMATPTTTKHFSHTKHLTTYYNNDFYNGKFQADDPRCEEGYKYNVNKRRCEDIDECLMEIDSCIEGQKCYNTKGSYLCKRIKSCGTGYMIDPITEETCIDIDECERGTHNCGIFRECVNGNGTFKCVPKVCEKGFKLNSEGICQKVLCPPGNEPNDFGKCVDINECLESPKICGPQMICRNTIGSYICKPDLNCEIGYKINEEETECEDVNECVQANHGCTGILMTCINTRGSYSCQCPLGYYLDHKVNQCKDINECLTSYSVCAANQKCENTYGSFRCLCKEGFEVYNDTCEDINECEMDGICHQRCVNTWGSFTCYCDEGYKIAQDKRMCEDIDECETAKLEGNQLCQGVCVNTQGSFKCTCPHGYQLDHANRTCLDINECERGFSQCFPPNDFCFNTRGSHKCLNLRCPKRFKEKPIQASTSDTTYKCVSKKEKCQSTDMECLSSPIFQSIVLIFLQIPIRPQTLYSVNINTNLKTTFKFDIIIRNAKNPKGGGQVIDKSYFGYKQKGRLVEVILAKSIDFEQEVEFDLEIKVIIKNEETEYEYGKGYSKFHFFLSRDPWNNS